ncbi:MAG: hypothetical protein AAB664_00965 [Patescibacteria group bacterium]
MLGFIHMGLYKQTKDHFVRLILGREFAPQGLVELNHYFRVFDPIGFRTEQQEDGSFVAISHNFRYGSIITHAVTHDQLDGKIKDAILTAFSVPSSYAKEAALNRVGETEYAFA